MIFRRSRGKTVALTLEQIAAQKEARPLLALWPTSDVHTLDGDLPSKSSLIGTGCYHVQGIHVGVVPPRGACAKVTTNRATKQAGTPTTTHVDRKQVSEQEHKA